MILKPGVEETILYIEIFRESESEDCFELIRLFNLNDLNDLNIPVSMPVQRAHRLGRKRDGQTRPIIVCFRDFADTDCIMRNAPILRNTQLSVSRDYPPEITDARKAIWPYFKSARESRKYNEVTIGYTAKLIINGRVVQNMFPDWFQVLRAVEWTPITMQKCGGKWLCVNVPHYISIRTV